VSAAISREGIPRRILGTWHAGFFTMVVSYDLLYELEAVLLRPYFRDKLTYSDVLAYVSWIREGAGLYESYAYKAPRRSGEERVSADPDDDYLYYLALDTMADYLVSGDSDLLQVSSDRVSILSPRRFWDDVLVPRL
jgi:putative PIN family toxin of toxin-antitoxin system